MADARRIGILAGGGTLPREIADSAAAQGIPVSIVAIDGEADADFGPHPVTVVNWGQIGRMVQTLKAAGTTELVIVGRVQRPEVWALKPDFGFFRYLPRLLKIVASGGDDSVLRRVIRFFERQSGVTVVAPGTASPELLIREGPIGKARTAGRDQADVRKGFEIIRTLGRYDIGQAVIVAGGRVEAIEGVEGTDAMLRRVAERRRGGSSGGVLVKRSKPGQDLRIDMPAIGPATVDGALAAGLAGIAVEAGQALVAERARTLSRADAAGLFVEGVVDDAGAGVPGPRFDPTDVAMPFRVLGRRNPERHARLDAVKGVAVVAALAPYGTGRAAVVMRNHVLAVEAGEGVAATVMRTRGLRQWASLTHTRRGVVAVREAADVTSATIAGTAEAGFAGIAIADLRESASLGAAIAAADRSGLFLIGREPEDGKSGP